MSHFEDTIAALEVHLQELDKQLLDTKNTINSLCKMAGLPARYEDCSLPVRGGFRLEQMKGDEYVGKPLATAVREYLERRKRRDAGPADIDEIFDNLREGGYDFGVSVDEKAKHGLHISLAKNTTYFLKLKNGKFALREWYPNLKQTKARASVTVISSPDSDSSQCPDIENADSFEGLDSEILALLGDTHEGNAAKKPR